MLHEWLNRVQSWRAQPHRPAEPEPYELTCVCGETLQGVRREHSQRHICRHCGEALLIFPLDVYPQPKPPRKRRNRRPRKRPVVIAASGAASPPPRGSGKPVAIGEDDTPPAHTVTWHEAVRSKLRSRLMRSGEPERQWTVPWHVLNPLRWPGWLLRAVTGGVRRLLRWLLSRILAVCVRLIGGVRKQVTPLRLVFAAILMMVVLTAHFQLRRAARDRAEITFRESAEVGMAAFSDGDFFTAAEHLQHAVDALALLQLDTVHAREVRVAAREATAATRLLDATLDEVVAAAERHRAQGRLDAWPDAFRAEFSGQWLVFEATVERFVDADGKTHFRTEPYTTEQGTDVVLDVDLPIFAALWPTADGSGNATHRAAVAADASPDPSAAAPARSESQDVIFAAELSSCTLDENGTWHLRFNSGTACLWVHAQAYRRLLGLDPAEETRPADADPEWQRVEAILRRQAVAMGLGRTESSIP